MAQMSSEQKKVRKKQHKYDKETKLSSPNCAPVVKPFLSSLMDPVNLSLRNEQEKDETVKMSGLTDTCYCTTQKTLASVIGSMVANTLGYPDLEKHDLVIQFSIYFEDLGWKTENYMTASTGTCLLNPIKLVLDENVAGMISPAMQLNLERVAQFTVTVRR